MRLRNGTIARNNESKPKRKYVRKMVNPPNNSGEQPPHSTGDNTVTVNVIEAMPSTASTTTTSLFDRRQYGCSEYDRSNAFYNEHNDNIVERSMWTRKITPRANAWATSNPKTSRGPVVLSHMACQLL